MRMTTILAMLLGAITGCNAVTGNGVPRLETRQVAAFSAVEVSAVIHAKIAIGASTALVLSADSNELRFIVTEVVGGRLVVRLQDGVSIDAKTPILVSLTTPALVAAYAADASTIDASVMPCDQLEAHASGTAEIHVRGVDAAATTIEASDDATIELVGRSGSTHVTASGATAVQTQALDAADVLVEASDASRVDVEASRTIAGTLSGASSLRVWGKPGSRMVATSEAAAVQFE